MPSHQPLVSCNYTDNSALFLSIPSWFNFTRLTLYVGGRSGTQRQSRSPLLLPSVSGQQVEALLYCHNCHFKQLLILYWTSECCDGRDLSSCPFLCVPNPSLSSTKEVQVIVCSEKPFTRGALPTRTNRQRSIIVLRWVKKRNPTQFASLSKSRRLDGFPQAYPLI